MAHTCPALCTLPPLPRRGKINGPGTPTDLGDLRSRFLRYSRRQRKKSVKAFNALIYSSNLTVVNDRRSFDGISSINRFLSTLCRFGISRVRVSGLAIARKLAPRYSGCRNVEMLRSTRTVLPRTRF
jgi:hypothetical protein